MSLPNQIFSPNVPIGTLNANGDVVMNQNWWLLFYNLVQNVLANSLPASALIEMSEEYTDSEVSGIPALARALSNAEIELQMDELPVIFPANIPEDEPTTSPRISPEALIALLSDYVPSNTFSNQIRLALGTAFVNQSAPNNPSSSSIALYSASSGSSAQNQLNTLDPNGASIVLGFENHMVVYNGSGSDIAVGQLVYIAGSHATTPSIALAKADSATTLPAVGFTQYAIPNGSYGQIHVSGSVAATTTGFSDGDTIYVSASSAGAFTKTAPSTAGQYVQPVGVVTNGGVGAGAGRLQFLFLTPLQATLSAAAGYTVGDLLYASSSTVLSRLSDVAAGSFLRSGGTSTAPAWSTVTVPNAATTGDIWYGSASNAISALSGNTTTTRKFLRQTGDGVNSAAPAWDTLVAGDLPTTLLEGDGSASAPSYSYSADSANGDYRIGTNSVGTATSGILRVAIDSSGRQLIGMAQTTGSTLAGGNGQIQLAGTSQALAQISIARYSNDNGSPFFVFNKSRGTTIGSVTAVTSSDVLATVATAGSDGTNLSTQAAQIRVVVDAAVSAGVVPGQIQLRTATTAGSITTAVQIDSSQDSLFKGHMRSDAGTKGIGYATGAGGTVTQTSSRTNGVTLNKVCGSITLVSAAGSATYQTFTVSNSVVAATDTIIVNQKSGTDLYIINVTAVAASSFNISFATTGGTTTEQPVFNFAVLKAVAA